MRGFEDHYVSVTGILTRYWQAGLQGSPIILLHGIGCSVLDWEQSANGGPLTSVWGISAERGVGGGGRSRSPNLSQVADSC